MYWLSWRHIYKKPLQIPVGEIIWIALAVADIWDIVRGIIFNKTLPGAGIPVISPLFSILTNRIYNGALMGIVFLYVILCVSLNKKSIIKTGGKTFEFLGNISYGMYMYHVMTTFVVIAFMKGLLLSLPVATATITYYLLCVFFTILVAYLSYVFFEKRFLRLKKKFEQV